MTDDEKKYVNDYIKQMLTVNTDEIEGQQVIELNNINLCSVDQEFSYPDMDQTPDEILNNLINDNDTVDKIINTDPDKIKDIVSEIHTDNRIIIEFADATISDPNPVQYSINVKPGEQINNDTIIGTVTQKGKQKAIKSIFERATVMSTSDNMDYFRLYPDNCNRHIVLSDYVSGNGHTIDVSVLEQLNDVFIDEGYLYALITNNMCQSLLPYILSHRIRGVFKQKNLFGVKGKWYFDESNSDLSLNNELNPDSSIQYTYTTNKNFVNNKQLDYPYVVYDNINENANNGIIIYDSSVLQVVNDLQDQFAVDMLGCDITKDDMKSWKKRAKKKKNRKKVKKEITDKVEAGTSKFKTNNPLPVLEEEKDRLLAGRSAYIDSLISLYENRDQLPLCKYDEEYTDCKFLVNDTIDKDILKQTKKFDEDFSYIGIGDSEEYYNYYISILSNINISNSEDKYAQEYYEIITDIINKRLIVEQCDVKTLQENFCKLYNENISDFFNINKDEKKNTESKINSEFNKLSLHIDTYSTDNNYKDLSPYMQAYNYMQTQQKTDDEDDNSAAISQLATMYTYIKSYGNGKNNKYKDLKTENDKYLYFKLVIEESNKICEFWNRILAIYKNSNMQTCIDNLYSIAYSFNDDALWPAPSEIIIDNIKYKHYLFENIYDKEYDEDDNIDIGDYNFPDHIDFPEIPDDVSVDQQWAIDQLNGYDFVDFDNPNVISIKDFKYWQKYFSLATLICLPPIFWNCGLDIIPFIQLIPLPCIFIAISSVYIRLFGIIMVFGIAIRGMYPWPIILYVNTTNQPVSILTPLLVVVNQLKDLLNSTLDQLEIGTMNILTESLIKILEEDNNNLVKENKKLDTYIQVCKHMKVPNAESLRTKFDLIADPSIDTRQRIQRIETISNQIRVI